MNRNVMSVNTLHYVLESRWEENTELDKVLKNFYFRNILKIPKLKTNDSLIVYALNLSLDGKNAFKSAYSSWKSKKDAETCNILLQLFFISELTSNNRLQKEREYFLKNTEINDIESDFKCTLIFLKRKQGDKTLKVDCDNTNVLSLIASMLIYHETRDKANFYKLQKDISNIVKTEKLDILDKIAVCLFSRMEEFNGIQLDRNDSLEFLKSHSKDSFYNHIKECFKEAILRGWGWYSINTVLLLLTLSKYVNWIKIDEIQWSLARTSGIPQYIVNISSSTLWITFLLSIIIVIIIRLLYFFMRLKKL